MGPDEELTIGAASQRSGLAPSALRFYEDQGLIHARRTEGGQRRYRRDVLRRLAIVGAAQRVGFSLEAIGEMLAEVPDDHHVTEDEWRALAAGWRPRIDEQITDVLAGGAVCRPVRLARAEVVGGARHLGTVCPGHAAGHGR